MGLFRYVAFQAHCWRCGQHLPEWQTKCHEDLWPMTPLQLSELGDGDNFYELCAGCQAWNEYRLEDGCVVFNKDASEWRSPAEDTTLS